MKIKSVKTAIGNFNSIYSEAGLVRLEYIENEIPSYPSDQQLQKYLNSFFKSAKLKNLPLLDLQGSYFQLKVWHALCAIPRGSTVSYKELAGKIGLPGASRAVGTACRLNPIPLFIPCHRVIRKDGSIGEFALGVKNKKFLLEMEAA